jgi:predicted Zn-dependent protease
MSGCCQHTYITERRLWASIVAIFCFTFSFAAAANSELPSLGENSAFNINRETALGRSVYERLLAAGLVETNPLLDRYINDLGFRLLAGVDNRVRAYRFFLVRDDSVNAFALPGGYIGINRGLIRIARTQHQLASVIGHEIAHVELRHGMDMMAKGSEINSATLLTMLAGLVLGAAVDAEVGSALLYGGVAAGQQAMVNFTRENEYEADRIGIGLMHDANFDPNGMTEMFTIMGNNSGNSGGIEYLRTHPLSDNRVAEAAGRAKSMTIGSNQVDDYWLFKDYMEYVSRQSLSDQGSDYRRALAAILAGNYSRADKMLGELYHRENENIWYSVGYAENLEHLRREADAELVYRRLLDIFPGDYVLSMRLVHLLRLTGQYKSALVIARRLENEYPQNQQIYFELSELYRSMDRPSLRMMAEAEFHRIAGDPRQAIRLYDQVLASSDTDSATASEAREKRLQLLEKEN